MSALGQDIQWWSTDVRFTLESRHGCAYRNVRFVPIADITHRSERSLLSDHLVRAGEQCRCKGKVLGTSLFGANESAQDILILAEGLIMVSFRFGELTRQHIGSDHRER